MYRGKYPPDDKSVKRKITWILLFIKLFTVVERATPDKGK